MSIEVRARHVNDVTSLFLASVPFEDIDDVIPKIKTWGGFYIGSDDDPTEELSGQFVYDPDNSPGEVYFEVLIDG